MKNRPQQLFAVVPPGLESLCADELRALGMAQARPVPGGVEFPGGLRELYQANLWSRTASRILVQIGEFRSRDFPDFFRRAARLPWGGFLHPGQPFQVRVNSRRSRLLHSERIAEALNEAVAQALGHPDQRDALPQARVQVQIADDLCRISVDSSGEHLHRRGYRRRSVPAPLRENLAAGILLALGWRGETPLLDPLCGSGTFVIEAALIAAGLPPGGKRHFAFMDWPGYRPGLWQALVGEAANLARQVAVPLLGCDREEQAVAACRENASAAGVENWVDWQQEDFFRLDCALPPGLLVCNPPYGERLAAEGGVETWYTELGSRLRQDFSAWTWALLVPDPGLVGGWRERPDVRLRLRNGGLAVSLTVRD